MPRSILSELGWLLYFVIILVVAVYALNLLLVPHHFNPTIANVLAAFLAAFAYVATRAFRTRRS
jgi:hypothetical protein